jgi:hypothetical protein
MIILESDDDDDDAGNYCRCGAAASSACDAQWRRRSFYAVSTDDYDDADDETTSTTTTTTTTAVRARPVPMAPVAHAETGGRAQEYCACEAKDHVGSAAAKKSSAESAPVDERNDENAALLRELALPVSFDCGEFIVTVVCLGQLTTLASFQRASIIVPVGYVATCTFQCALRARKVCAYVCEVLIENNKPRFRVMPPCSPSRSVTTSSADTAWSKMHQTIKHGHKKLDGDRRFGLSHCLRCVACCNCCQVPPTWRCTRRWAMTKWMILRR